jgi:two-component system OmpR family response regulator
MRSHMFGGAHLETYMNQPFSGSQPFSANQPSSSLDDRTVLTLTKRGEEALLEPGTTLTPAQLEALVLIGGSATIGKILKRAPSSISADALRASLNELVDRKYLSANAGLSDNIIDPGDFFSVDKTGTATPEVDEHVHARVDADTEFLRQNGFYVSMVRKSAVKPDRAAGQKISVLVIEDDPDILKLLQIFLKLEGYETRTASNRDEIVAAFRAPPLPDLVLLDIRLPDINGFDILARMRQHPAMKVLPVIMLTAEATREAVLKGLVGGADGFVTKPFQIDRLVKAVKTVLGLKLDPEDRTPTI